MIYDIQNLNTSYIKEYRSINWGHPLAKDLIGCWLMNPSGRIFKDLVGEANGTEFNTIYSVDSVRFSASTSAINLPQDKYNFERTDKLSWFAIISNITFGVAIMNIIGRQVTTNNQGWIWGLNNDSTLALLLLNDNSPSNQIQAKSTNTLEDGSLIPYKLMTTYNGSSLGSGVKHYINGRLETTVITADTLTASIKTNGTPRIGVDPKDAAGNNLNANLHYLCMWNRELTPDEALWMNDEPYCFLNSYNPFSFFNSIAATTTLPYRCLMGVGI